VTFAAKGQGGCRHDKPCDTTATTDPLSGGSSGSSASVAAPNTSEQTPGLTGANQSTAPTSTTAPTGDASSSTQSSGSPTPGTKRYVVVLEDGVADPGAVAAKQAQSYGAQVARVYRSALKGYAASIPSDKVAALRADP